MKFLRRLVPVLFLATVLSCTHKPLVTNVNETHYIINQNAIDSNSYKTILPYKKNHDEQMAKVVATSTDAFLKAAAAVPASGGVLYVPAGDASC